MTQEELKPCLFCPQIIKIEKSFDQTMLETLASIGILLMGVLIGFLIGKGWLI